MFVRHFNSHFPFSIKAIPILKDNFSYIIEIPGSVNSILVDPAEPSKILPHLTPNLNVSAILTTHHHLDHAGGNAEIKLKFPEIEIFGFDQRITGLTYPLKDEEKIDVGALSIVAWHTPCHTTGSICYVLSDGESQVVFTGDTLFLGGCGRFFEGDADDMMRVFDRFRCNLPDDAIVCPGHDYTLRNLEFASSLVVDDKNIAHRLENVRLAGSNPWGKWAEEKLTNIFLHTDDHVLQSRLKVCDRISALKLLRELKDDF